MKNKALALGLVGFASLTIVSIGHTGPKKPTVKYADVQAVFNSNCVRCHSGPRARDGVDLSSYDKVMAGSMKKIVKPGDAAGSRLYQVISGSKNAPQMPPRGPALDATTVKKIETWIKEGAKNS